MTSAYYPSQLSTPARFILKGTLKHDDSPERSPSPALLPIGAKRPSSPYGAPPSLRARRREGRIYHTPSSSQSSLESADSEFSFTSPRTPITISLPIYTSPDNTVRLCVKPAPKRPVLELAPEPSHASVADSPVSPLSPAFPNALSPDARIRKMAKLTRTLGENVPPELVFPQSHCSARQARRRSMSLAAVDRPRTNTAADVPQSPPPFSAGASFTSEQETQTWRRKEREWSGEWNVQDYERVVRGLRGLKARK